MRCSNEMRAVALLTALAALGCDAAQFVPIGDPDGGGTADAGPMGCGRMRPARPPGEDDGVATERVYVFRDIVFFPPGTEWTTIGYDLDGTCTTADGPTSCTNDLGTVVDGESGVDNAWGARIASTVQAQYGTFEGEVHALQAAGQYDIIIRVRGWNGTANDPLVEIDFAGTVCGVPDGSAATCASDPPPVPLWDGNDTFYLNETAFIPMMPTEPRVQDTAGYVRDGVLVARIPDHENLEFSSGNRSIRVGLTDATITMTVFPEMTPIDDAVLAGRWATTDILATTALLGICPGDPLSGPILSVVTNTINAAADVRSDPGSDGMGVPCDAVSISLRGSAYPGRWGGPVTTPPLPSPCM